MPTNVYGENDNFDSFGGHVIPAMITKFIKAKKEKKKIINLLGTGRPIREFIYTDDLANAIFKLLKTSKYKLKKLCGNNLPIINVGSGESITIKNLANYISKLVGFKGKIKFDNSYPDGTYKKNLNSNRIRKLGWKPETTLKFGLKKVVNNRIDEY